MAVALTIEPCFVSAPSQGVVHTLNGRLHIPLVCGSAASARTDCGASGAEGRLKAARAEQTTGVFNIAKKDEAAGRAEKAADTPELKRKK